jgi:hypothetical protein
VTPQELRDDYDWQQAFYYARYVSPVLGWDGSKAPFTIDDVTQVIAVSPGFNDDQSWIGLFLLDDGRYAFVSAWCDYTGWDCQAGGGAFVGPDVETMVRLALGDADRARLADQLT